MKTISIIFACLSIFVTDIFAQSTSVKNTAKSVFTLTTFGKDGSIIASSHGVFTGSDGQAISSWSPFIGAASAVVIDSKGEKMNVEAIIGANELYDVCKFRVAGKTVPAAIASAPVAVNGNAWIVGYSTQKPVLSQITVQRIEKFMDKYSYYVFSNTVPENLSSCPIVNQNGQVIGLLQHSKSNTDVCATDANYINSFILSGLTINDPALKQTDIRTALPDKQEDALVTLMLAGQQKDSVQYVQYVSEFIKKFPTSVDGYNALAQTEVEANKFDDAAANMEKAIKLCTKKDEAHSSYSKLIYQKEIYKSDKPYAAWSFDRALDEAKQAYAINPLPVYQHQQAQIIFSKGDYQQAFNMFIELCKTPLRNGELFYEAAQCKAQLKAPHTEILALIDSAIKACPQPLNSVAAPYVLARGAEWEAQNDYRKAVADYNLYDSLMYGRPISSQFYYTREQCELQIHQYQQALNDISRAIIMTPGEPTYWAEKASVHLRVNQQADAIKSAQRCIQLAPQYADGYVILGLAQIQSKDKVNGLQNLEKAKELGDTRADELIKKYK